MGLSLFKFFYIPVFKFLKTSLSFDGEIPPACSSIFFFDLFEFTFLFIDTGVVSAKPL